MKIAESELKILKDKYGYTKREINSLRKLNGKNFYFVESLTKPKKPSKKKATVCWILRPKVNIKNKNMKD